ncbi:MATE family multidrug resistance protein [Flavobacterium sp. CG_9.1]|uniref:MATE family efflux transporter n=1 Tax=Flavobacterium sp. CG_9.1 TaxID=2787728 RepID=UPI0018C8E8D1|nr:MATE family efflux transporter [Flavobacterium sp. CG_9.1]MBG6063655.1 MATE family multidrug resistance protein [Flavobacterium sp. CG_9.1]
MIPLLKQNIKLAFPIFLGQLAFTFISFIDNIMIGRLGASPLSAFSLSNNLIFLAFALNIGFTMMFTPLISEMYCIGKIKETKNILFHGFVVYTVLGIILFVILKILLFNLSNFGQSEQVVKTAKPYFSILLYSFIPAFLFQILKQFSDGVSKPKIAMYCILASLILNVSLNYCLIFGKFGLPKLGLLGSAIGTLISRCFLFFVLLICILKNNETKIFFKNLINHKFKFSSAKQIISLGSFSSFQVFFKITLLTSSVILSGKLSTTAQASNQIILSISALMFSIPFSLGTASAIQSSKLLAQKNSILFKKSLQSFFILSLFCSVIFTIVFQILKNKIPTIYINDNSVIFTVANTFVFLSLFQLIDSLETIALGTLKGVKDTLKPFFIAFFSYNIIAIPLSIILSKIIGIKGIWLGLSIGLIISLLFLIARIRRLYQNS